MLRRWIRGRRGGRVGALGFCEWVARGSHGDDDGIMAVRIEESVTVCMADQISTEV